MAAKIGWIGLGNMGTPMVKHLVKAGYEVSVYNRNEAKTAALKNEVNISIAASPAALATDSEFIIMSLSNDAAVKDVVTGANGILSGEAARKVTIIDMSTVSPDTTIELASLCKNKGIDYLDAPVSGSVKQALDAQLVIMVGGEGTAYENAKPVLAHLGKASFLMGTSGAGNSTKLAINLFLGITVQGLSEAVVFAESKGIEAKNLLPLINMSALGSTFTQIKSNAIIDDNFKAAFALKHLAKDIKLAKDKGLDSPLGNALSDSLQAALTLGLGEEDAVAVLTYLREKQERGTPNA
ncbi:NAD(P)-dependent oxidoreductase [Chitinophagaceae bacterium LWZ2-11]